MTVKLSIPASLLMPGSVGRQTIGSLGSSEDSTTGSLRKQTFSERHPKAVKSVTVIGYLISVSLAAILLSAYYVLLWKPKDPQRDQNPRGNFTNHCRLPPYPYPPGQDGQPAQSYRLGPTHYTSKRKYSRITIPYKHANVQGRNPPNFPVGKTYPSVPFESSHYITENNSNEQTNSSQFEAAVPSDYSYDTSSNSRTTWGAIDFTQQQSDGKSKSDSYPATDSHNFPTKPSFPIISSSLFKKLLEGTGERTDKRNINHQLRKHYR